MDNYIRKLLILQFTKTNLMKNLLLISALIFLFACKKETVTPPVIPPTDTTAKLMIHLLTGGEGSNATTQYRINNAQAITILNYIDTTCEVKLTDTILLVCYSDFQKDWATIKYKGQVAFSDTSEYSQTLTKPARAEYIIK